MAEQETPPDEPEKSALARALEEHAQWLASDGREGTQFTTKVLEGIDWGGARPNLWGAILTKADLPGTDLWGTNLTGADLSEADLSGADLWGATLIKADLSRADLSRADLSGTSLRGTNLSRANLWGADLSEANLLGANLLGANMVWAGLWEANLSGADLSGADLSGADLTGAELSRANLSEANLSEANLTGCVLTQAKLAGSDLRGATGLRLDNCFVRGAQFSPVSSRWWALLSNRVLGPLYRYFTKRNWTWLARRTNYPVIHNDPWSVLRQLYSGPRTLFLFFFVIAFALPYVGRVALYGAEAQAGAWASEAWQRQKERLQNDPERLVVWLNDPEEIERTVRDKRRVERELAAMEEIERTVRAKAVLRPVWQVLLRWDEGKVWPTVLAVLLVLYNLGVYWLITGVAPLRDEEERSGWSPAWKDYSHLRWAHRAVTLLFYVSFASFMVNVWELLGKTVWVPAG